MRTAATMKLTLTVLVGSLSFALLAASCKPATRESGSGNGGSASGGSSGSGGNGSGGNGGSSTGGSGSGGDSTGGSGGDNTGGSASGGNGAGGSSGSGGDNTGGSSATGGSSGAGGSSSSGLDCKNAIVPANGSNGGVTDFSDWSSSSGKWGSSSGLHGSVYSYAGSSSSMNTAKVEGTPTGLHLTGGVAANDYGGGGLGFDACTTVASFTQVQFDIVGSSPGCDLELQIQTFDQRPKTQTPPGGCDSSCYNFPVVKQIVDLSSAISSPKTVTTSLKTFSSWGDSNAAQVVGLQWQFTGTNVTGDAGATCPIDVTISNVKFLP
jgi:hypothetical protein